MAKIRENSANSEEFWHDDAVRLAEREHVDATGFRMPLSSAVHDEDLEGSHARTSADWNATSNKSAEKSIAGTIVVCLLVLVSGAFAFLAYRLPVITLVEFNELQRGITIERANEIVGRNGATVMAVELPNDSLGFKETQNIQWINRDGSNAVAGFMDGRLFVKAQIGLQ